MVYVIGNKGFFKEQRFDTEKMKAVFIWSNTIQEARPFKNAGKAEKFLKRNKLKGFIWKPYEENHIQNKYRVVKYKPQFSWSEKNELGGWIVEKVMMESNSEIKFLSNSLPKDYYDLEDAEMICEQKNKEAIENFYKKFPILNKNNDDRKI